VVACAHARGKLVRLFVQGRRKCKIGLALMRLSDDDDARRERERIY